MKLFIDISKDRYDEIMSMDWANCRRFFDEEIRAIHDGKVIEQEPCTDAISRQAAIDGADAIIARDTSGNNDVVKAMTAWKSYVEGLPPATALSGEYERALEIIDKYRAEVRAKGMISAGYKSAYQQGYSDAMRDFRKKSKSDVLDKIREEIKSEKFGLTDTEDGRRIQSDIHASFDGGIECALQIIDKYREPTGVKSEEE